MISYHSQIEKLERRRKKEENEEEASCFYITKLGKEMLSNRESQAKKT